MTMNRLIVCGMAVCLLFGGTAAAQQATGEQLESARATLAQWVETQQMISKEKEDWQVGREILEQRVELVQDEIASLEKKLALARESVAEANAQQRDLSASNLDLTAGTDVLGQLIVTLEERTRELLGQLPQPIVDKVEPLSERIPEDPARTKKSVSERFQNVVGILNEVNKFNSEITVATEVRDLGNGKTAQVSTIYIGIGQAYYADAKGEAAGVGRPGPEGWAWTRLDEHAQAILKAIAIYRNEKPATFIGLPVRINQ